MRRDTFRAAIREFCRVAPFQRFTVELVNGERMIGYHPELFIFEGDLVHYVDDEHTIQFFDATSVLRVVNVVIPPGAH